MPTSTLSLNPSFVNNTSRTTKPIIISSFKTKPISSNLKFHYKKPSLRIVSCISSENNNGFVKDNEEESGPPLQVESEVSSKPRRIALFVEPSPFAYVSGYKNRFQNFIKYLREMGDEVMVVTTHEGVPQEFHGAKIIGSRSFPCPWYQNVPLSLALSPRIINEVKQFKPDIIHASSPGIMVFGALAIAKMLCVPIVMSYHTHVPVYIPRYTFSWLVKPMWLVITNKIRLWNKGVDSESFHPKFRSHEMRVRLTNGEPDRPLVVHVGRLGVEKSLDFLKSVMDKIPEARIAFVGDGPHREDLEKLFSGMPVVFTGMLQGEELSQAYASGDVFITPSESETLGFVVLEAMSSGLPVIAARAGGIPDIIPEEQEGKTGYLFD
nr:sulfoquinovosyl transferase SQD2-like [Tanacetum cinerariifolium]